MAALGLELLGEEAEKCYAAVDHTLRGLLTQVRDVGVLDDAGDPVQELRQMVEG